MSDPAALTDRAWLRVCCVAAVAWVVSPSGASVTPRDPHQPIALRDLVSQGGLRAHELEFDARFAQAVLDQPTDAEGTALDRMAALPATAHLLGHARQFDYDLARRGAEPADREAWAVIDRMSGGERLWYRVGARMAARIEHRAGRPALVRLLAGNPLQMVETYRRLIG